MDIKPATKADLPILATLFLQVQKIHAEAMPWMFKYPLDRDAVVAWLEELLDDGSNLFFLGWVQGQPVGYVFCQVFERSDRTFFYASSRLYVHHIGVDEAQRGRGYGSTLMQFLEDMAESEGIEEVALDVWAFNQPALEFYRRRKFEVSRYVMRLR